MRKLLVLLILILLPTISFAKEYINAAIKINIEQNTILGMVEMNGERKLFNFSLDKSDFNDGHTFVIYKKWMPEIPAGYGLRMHINHPDEFMVVTENNRSRKTYTGVQYEFDDPSGGVTLAFSDKWMKETKRYKGIDISTYFTVKNRVYTQSYFSRIEELLKIYIDKLGKYPYSSFKVVDVPFPAGQALTGMTFISNRIISMPFLTEVSLGHELVHQWSGVGVSPDLETGNWAEGLTTYLADRLYAVMNGEGAEYRKNAIISYMAHSRQKEDGTCLMEFKYKTDKTSKAIGYAKSMMIFSMLESMIGEEDFEKGIKVFLQRNMHKTASWDEMIVILEDVSGIYLKGFLDGWLAETALVEFDVTDVKVSSTLDGYSVSFNIANKYDWLEYPLDIVVKTEEGDVFEYLYIKEKGKRVAVKTKSKPTKLIIDPKYKAARYLTDAEMPPVLHHLFSKYDKTIFVDPADRDKYTPFIMSLKNAEVVSDSEPPYLFTDNVLIFLGEGNKAYKKLYGKDIEPYAGDFMVKSVKHPMANDRMSYVVISKDMETTKKNSNRVRHYGKYSSLTLDNGRSYDKVIDESDAGIIINLLNDKQGVAVQKPLSIEDIVRENADTKVFLVGEVHSEFAHHENQLNVIRQLRKNNKDVAIGLEMIQRPSQKYLDAYIAGDLSQKEMLKKTEYYSRWRFDFRLYKRIFDYAKANKIPLVALNLEQEITKKVSANGIFELSDEDLEKIPSDIEYTGGKYKEFLMSIFSMHKGDKNFYHFYEAQLLWDETMAETAANYIAKNPNKTLVVLAGNGHLRFGHGIADRLKRRTGQDYTLIVQDEDNEEGIADYILYPEKMEFEESPKIGVMVDETDEGLLVMKVINGSFAAKAGVENGDYIIEFGGQKIFNLNDIRLSLLFAENGKVYTLLVRRNDKVESLNVTFDD
ncbi:MAG: hypothetical protein C0603_05515 [Denitrovibrio sp.]|nr:MAG: hypothetical protein C0603_05515 [Denitrovibrio sp.]